VPPIAPPDEKIAGALDLSNLVSLWFAWIATEGSGVIAVLMCVLAARDLLRAERFMLSRAKTRFPTRNGHVHRGT
jgi:hypothetical protein